MPTESIVGVKIEDDNLKTLLSMSKEVGNFSSNLEDMQKVLKKLTENEYELKLDVDGAKRNLDKAQKVFNQSKKSEEDYQKLLKKRDAYIQAQRNFELVSNTAVKAKKHMEETASTLSKAENRTSSSGLMRKLVKSDIGKAAGKTLLNVADMQLEGMFGKEIGGAISGMISGAQIGFSIGGLPGAAIGGLVNAGVELVNGLTENRQEKTKVIKDYVQNTLETAKSSDQERIAMGSEGAKQDELDRLEIKQMLDDPSNLETVWNTVTKFSTTNPIMREEVIEKTKSLLSQGTSVENLEAELIQSFGGEAYLNALKGTYEGQGIILANIETERMNEIGKAYNDERSEGIQKEIDFYNSDGGKERIKAEGMVAQAQAREENEFNSLENELWQVVTGKLALEESSFKDSDQAEIITELIVEYEEANKDITGGTEEEKKNQRIDQETTMTKFNALIELLTMNESKTTYLGQKRSEAEEELYFTAGKATALNELYVNVDGAEKALEKGVSEGFNIGIKRFIQGMNAYGEKYWSNPDYNFDGMSEAFGLPYVPYDGFPALLHEGERVLTANQARQMDRNVAGVNIQIASMQVRENADIDRIARELYRKMSLAREVRGNAAVYI